MNGMATTFAVRIPHSLSMSTVVPGFASRAGSQQNPMFFRRRGE